MVPSGNHAFLSLHTNNHTLTMSVVKPLSPLIIHVTWPQNVHVWENPGSTDVGLHANITKNPKCETFEITEVTENNSPALRNDILVP